ncbi:MAG: DUF4124 domain-containing protein [Rhizobacter sp.]|nr:DUF4124 domain-containing protein [Rhizobacter sp.]
MQHTHLSNLAVRASLLVLMASLPWAAQAAWTCTNQAGKTTFQDRPCEGKAPSDKWAPVKTRDLSSAGAQETLRRFDAAVNERDLVAAGRLLSKDFRSLLVDKRGRHELGRNEYMESVTRAVQAAQRYQGERRCNDGRPDALSQSLRLECRNAVRVDQSRRGGNSVETLEIVRLVLEGDEIKIVEISSVPPQPASGAAPAPKN